MRTAWFCGSERGWRYDVTSCLAPCSSNAGGGTGTGGGRSGPRGGGVMSLPNVDRMTQACENFTFPQLRLRAAINSEFLPSCIHTVSCSQYPSGRNNRSSTPQPPGVTKLWGPFLQSDHPRPTVSRRYLTSNNLSNLLRDFGHSTLTGIICWE